jgi:hypothetical protein
MERSLASLLAVETILDLSCQSIQLPSKPSSASTDLPTDVTLYRAFITQFSRSMHVECWSTGVDFLVVTPFYVVSNLYKRQYGTIVAPLPIKLVEGSFKQLGKKYIWQVGRDWLKPGTHVDILHVYDL